METVIWLVREAFGWRRVVYSSNSHSAALSWREARTASDYELISVPFEVIEDAEVYIEPPSLMDLITTCRDCGVTVPAKCYNSWGHTCYKLCAVCAQGEMQRLHDQRWRTIESNPNSCA